MYSWGIPFPCCSPSIVKKHYQLTNQKRQKQRTMKDQSEAPLNPTQIIMIEMIRLHHQEHFNHQWDRSLESISHSDFPPSINSLFLTSPPQCSKRGILVKAMCMFLSSNILVIFRTNSQYFKGEIFLKVLH